MKTVEISAALILAITVFVVMKLIGMVLNFAAVAALVGFVAGLALARALRRPGA